MRLTALWLALAAYAAAAPADNTVTISKAIYDTSDLAFRPTGSYLQLAVPYEPVEPAFAVAKQLYGRGLKSRGEAHITVITPAEYHKSLQQQLSIDDINAIAEASNLQSSKFTAECIGTATKLGSTVYFIVVKSDDLLTIRRAIAKAFVDAGGDPSAFDADAYWPHITLGFTKRDLFSEDGVFKDMSTCVRKLSVQ